MADRDARAAVQAKFVQSARASIFRPALACLRGALALQLSLGSTLSMARGGRASPEVQQAYSRAYALCQQVGETPRVFQALRGLCLFAMTRGEHTLLLKAIGVRRTSVIGITGGWRNIVLGRRDITPGCHA